MAGVVDVTGGPDMMGSPDMTGVLEVTGSLDISDLSDITGSEDLLENWEYGRMSLRTVGADAEWFLNDPRLVWRSVIAEFSVNELKRVKLKKIKNCMTASSIEQ